MSKEKLFITKDENGNEEQFEMLLVKNVDDVPIIWYTDGSFDEEGRKNVYISKYQRTETTFALSPVDEKMMDKYADIFTKEYKED